ncbi:MAG TPA: MFS transporter [Patescibacteria group bacterium]|nr:MFS transporter [Patescibacteria group bacterium]
MTSPATVDVSELLDEQKVGSFQIRVLVLCALAVLLDGFNAQVIGYVAPALAVGLHLSQREMGPVFAASLVGVMVGTLTLGPLADRIGRRGIMIACTLTFGVLSAATALVNSFEALFLLRLFAGFGLGGAMPNAIALTAEFSPQRSRATMVMTMFCGFPIGAMIAGLAAAPMIPAYGWRSVFVLSGVLPILLVPVLIVGLPESIRHLVLEGGKSRQIAALLARIDPRLVFSGEANFIINEEQVTRAAIGSLFRQRRARATILLWIVFFASLLDLYLLSSWLPTVFHDAGLALTLSIVAAALFHAGGAGTSIVLGRFVDRFGAYRVLAWTYLLGAVAIALLGPARSAAGIMILAFCAGIGVIGGQMGANLVAASIYPTAIRSTGVGWALGIGRIGSIIGPFFGAFMLSGHWPIDTIFLASAVPAIVGAAAIYLMGRAQNATEAAGRSGPLPAPSGVEPRGA